MTIEQALEQVEEYSAALREGDKDWGTVKALALVLAAAKRPPALGEGERKVLESELTKCNQSVSPPFTREDYEWFQAWGKDTVRDSTHPHPEEPALLAKLNTYLESLPKPTAEEAGS